MLLELIKEYSEVVTTTAALFTVLAVLYTKVGIPMWEALKSYKNTSDKIDIIFTELTPNGGESIKDKIDRMDRDVQGIKARQRALIVDIDEPVFETDANGNCVWVNRTYTRITGRNASELYGHGWINSIYIMDRDVAVSEWYKAAADEREITIDFRFQSATGEITACTCRSYKMTDSKNKVIGYLGKIVIRTEMPKEE